MTTFFMGALVVLMCLTAAVWGLLLFAIFKGGLDKRFVLEVGESVGDRAQEAETVSIIIPARNEERCIATAVERALAQTYDAIEVIVVDDHSDDGTAAAATRAGGGDSRLRVEKGRALPEGWLGKPSACWHGQSLAEGAVFLFLDADVEVSPHAVRVCLEALNGKGLDMLSLWGTWKVVGFWEQVCQPVVGGFVRGAHPLDKVNDPQQPDAFANGQFIMIRREAYEQLGGHGVVKDEVLEDVRFAQRAKSAGLSCGMFLAPDLFEVRLYTSLDELWEGMLKNFYHGMNRSPGLAMLAAVFVSVMTLLPLAALAAGVLSGNWALMLFSALNVALMYAFRFVQDGQVGLSRLYGLTHPLGTAVLVGIIVISMWRGVRGAKTRWKGRPVQG